jgi:membrane protein implicated in regulation of membrane protease activity
MTWANFYLFCFLVGFLWSLLSLVVGHLNIDLFHGGHAGGDGGLHDFEASDASGHFGDGGMHDGIGADHGDFSHPHGDAHGGSSDHLDRTHISPLNLGTIAAFAAWFGGAGYLLTVYSSLWFLWALLLSILIGAAGASIVFWFLAKVLVGHEHNLNPADYRMTGVLGHVSSFIRERGTGEIIYSQEGTRRTCGARSEDGKPIQKGTEVLVTRYQKGIAYVRRWDELSKSE